MMKKSAGILPYRMKNGRVEVLLVHPGGPFWAKKDLGAWSIAKGLCEDTEEPLQAARREFQEETGCIAGGPFRRLSSRKQPSGKTIDVWATEMDWDPAQLSSNKFTLEWPKASGKVVEFPEVDRAAWFNVPEAERRILPGQRGFLADLLALVTP